MSELKELADAYDAMNRAARRLAKANAATDKLAERRRKLVAEHGAILRVYESIRDRFVKDAIQNTRTKGQDSE